MLNNVMFHRSSNATNIGRLQLPTKIPNESAELDEWVQTNAMPWSSTPYKKNQQRISAK